MEDHSEFKIELIGSNFDLFNIYKRKDWNSDWKLFASGSGETAEDCLRIARKVVNEKI